MADTHGLGKPKQQGRPLYPHVTKSKSKVIPVSLQTIDWQFVLRALRTASQYFWREDIKADARVVDELREKIKSQVS